MSEKPTIEDIARYVGVSRSTVSRVINDQPDVSDETRQAILDAIEELNYRPMQSARHMRTANSNLVGFGLVTDEVITTPYAVDMIAGAQDALWERNKIMLVVRAGYGTELTAKSIEAMLERRVEGIIYASLYHRVVELPPNITEVPTVLANCFVADQSLPSVVPDETQGGYEATRHLLRQGHKRIGFLNLGGDPVVAASGRLEGYRLALREYDVPFDPELVLYTAIDSRSNFDLTVELMRLPQPPTAIFCGNDRTAMGCYGALASLGLQIPIDVAVVGYDNQLDIAEGLYPPLTTIQLPHYDMGRWAVEYLANHNNYDQTSPTQMKVKCPIVVRQSS